MDHSGKLMREEYSYFGLFNTVSKYVSDCINAVSDKLSLKRKHENAFGEAEPQQPNLEQKMLVEEEPQLPHPYIESTDEESQEPPTKKRKIAAPSPVVFDNVNTDESLTPQKPFIFTSVKSTNKPLNIKIKHIAVPVKPNLHKENRVLSAQETKDKALYAFEDRSLWGNTKLTLAQLKQIENLLIDGANPNYVPSQNEYRISSIEPCSLMAIAIYSGDVDFFNLLLKYGANIFQESKPNNLVLWDACTRVITPTVLKPEFVTILNTILEKLGTTTEEVRKNLPGTDIGIISLPQFVEDMKRTKSNVSSLRA